MKRTKDEKKVQIPNQIPCLIVDRTLYKVKFLYETTTDLLKRYLRLLLINYRKYLIFILYSNH